MLRRFAPLWTMLLVAGFPLLAATAVEPPPGEPLATEPSATEPSTADSPKVETREADPADETPSVETPSETPADKTQTAEPPAATASQIEFFEKQVRPILESRCLKCHGAEAEVEGALRLIDRASVLKGGELGPAVSLEEAGDSQLLRAIRYEDLEMPPSGKLARKQVDILTRWVEMGVPFSDAKLGRSAEHGEASTEKMLAEARSYWAYQPLERPEVPQVEDEAWVHNPIDAFIRHRLERANLDPAPPAPRVALLRRVYYDLIGLPPTPEEVDAFLEDSSPDAYEQVVERLLESPHYGEQWGRHWLDLVHYAETNGYERDGVKDNAWRYRDYVIDSLNQDKPFDRFVQEQLAGDELADSTPESLVATGYYRMGLWDDEPVDADQAYYDSLDDVVSTTSQVFLGMTVGCARCHDHKIDPIPQKDYYRLLAFFHNTYRDIKQLEFKKSAFTYNTQVVIADASEQAAHQQQVEQVKRQAAELDAKIAGFEQKVYDSLTAPEKDDAQDPKVRALLIRKQRDEVLSAEEASAMAESQKLRKELQRTKIPPLPTALVIKENGPVAPPTHVLIRGSAHAPGDEVQPGFPQALEMPDPQLPTPDEGASSSGRRLALARWIVSPENPLPARVLANRLWQHHFGRGIVRTPNDFGKFGERPTHPELLDWLATELMHREWHLKSMHRLIVTSNAYRMSSQGDQAALSRDPTNDLFWRYDMRRLTAEQIRDSILSTSGALNLELGGPSIHTEIPEEILASASRPDAAWGKSTPRQRNRRSIYIHVKRSLAEPVLKAFDLADTETSCAVRFATTVPTQSLTMLNGLFFSQQAAVFAERLRKEFPDDTAQQVHRALRLALCRTPRESEVARGVAMIDAWQKEDGVTAEKALEYYCLMVINLNEFAYLD
jgi:hypothetical protein